MKGENIRCAFCKGTGKNPHYNGNCPVCKGRRKNEVVGKYMPCSSCRGSGQKGGTTLACYDCGGLGIVPDTRETFRKAQEEIREAQEEMARERPGSIAVPRTSQKLADAVVVKMTKKRNGKVERWQEEKEEDESNGKTNFCQCCADKVNESIAIKICHDCFGKVKELRAYKE